MHHLHKLSHFPKKTGCFTLFFVKPNPRLLPVILLNAILFPLYSDAAVLLTANEGSASNAFDNLVSTTNLIQNGQSSLGSMTVDKVSFLGNAGFSTAGLNDGSAALNGNYAYWGTKNNADTASKQLPVTITFGLAGSLTGYDITEIRSFAGWGNSYLADQSFQLLLSINNGAYSDFGTYTNTTTLNGGNNSTMTVLTDSTGRIASGVTGIRFVFLNPGTTQGGDGGTLIRELQAFGSTTVPEPGAFGLLGASSILLAFIRQRRRSPN